MGNEKPLTETSRLVRALISRLAPFAETATGMDYGRIEELCFLIRETMAGKIVETGWYPDYTVTINGSEIGHKPDGSQN